jgi:hypothetical protein
MEDNVKSQAPDDAALLEGDSLKKLLMAKVRAQGRTKAVDSKTLFRNLVQQSLEALLELEMEEHLGYEKHDPAGRGTGNSRNGHGAKTVPGDFGQTRIDTPRDRNSSFDPKIVAKRQTSIGNFTETVISLYARVVNQKILISFYLHDKIEDQDYWMRLGLRWNVFARSGGRASPCFVVLEVP